ncbi:putative NADH-ubiquinone reductase complex 1 MLRQ subunit [Helianthus debilis subsp. tardiflorus]
MSSSTLKRWLRPEVYPLFAALGVAVGICGMQLVRNISGNPEVRKGDFVSYDLQLNAVNKRGLTNN